MGNDSAHVQHAGLGCTWWSPSQVTFLYYYLQLQLY